MDHSSLRALVPLCEVFSKYLPQNSWCLAKKGGVSHLWIFRCMVGLLLNFPHFKLRVRPSLQPSASHLRNLHSYKLTVSLKNFLPIHMPS